MNKNRAVLYLRLSKEDINKLSEGDDSASIKNQRLLLQEYALEHDFKVIEVYSDDDESGLYDDRAGFEKLIEDSKLGKFDIVIAKSQSRFSRNMEHIEKYLHHDFVLMDIRFIGVADNADTSNAGNKKSRQIYSLVNEWYCEDLSSNIKSVFKAKMHDGQFLGSSAPYGYLKDPSNHNHLVIDEYAASVVKRIFTLYLDGNGKGKIASIISEDGILIPTLYKQRILKSTYQNGKLLNETKVWSYQTIHSILNNETYIGNLVQNRANKVSFKDRKVKSLPKEKWVIVPNTHEPIIDVQTWNLVQEMQKRKIKGTLSFSPNGIFSGMMFCADCKKSMGRSYARRGNREFIGYICSTYKTQGKRFCLSHAIKNDKLENAVLQSIKAEAHKILSEEDIDQLSRYDVEKHGKVEITVQVKQLESEIAKIAVYKKKAFESMVEGVISREEFENYTKEYDDNISILELQINNLKEYSNVQSHVMEQYDEWVSAFKHYIDIDKLDRDVVLHLINRIEVDDDGSITIYYKFSNPYETVN
ncbi:MAG: recombinase family protein [Hespellia sp.]|nr:recombinase family protein [Hespellia sp.]